MKKLAYGIVLAAAVALGAASTWAGSTSPHASGGEVTIVGDNQDAVHSFTNVGANTFTLFSEHEVWFLVVGGGGAGGTDCSGGGGGGGFVESNHVVLAAGTYTVTVGNGGQTSASSGGDSIISVGGAEIVRAKGGGAGGSFGAGSGIAGGSGGGGANGSGGGPGVPGQGYAGGNAATRAMAGGGGAGGPGEDGNHATGPGNNGGPGKASDITGVEVYYAGGGGGGGYSYSAAPMLNGGIGGGGNGARNVSIAMRQANTLDDGRNEYEAERGVNGLGGGGGGANNSTSGDGQGRPGGSGVVIMRIPGEPDTALQVSGTPEYIGEPSPAYGYVTNLVAGDTFAVSCGVAAVTNEEQTILYSCVGWKLYDKNGNVVSSGSGTDFTYAHPTPAAFRRLEWQWSKFVVGTIAAGDFGSVSPSGTAWFRCDTPVTVTATPDSSLGFAYWSGTLPAGIDATAASVTFRPSEPFEMTAFFGGAHFTKTRIAGGDSLYTFFASGPVKLVQSATARLLLVGGGGAGGRECAGGGGAGGMIDTNNVELAAGTYTITVGAGGQPANGRGGNGGDSSIAIDGVALFTAIGGGGGASFSGKTGGNGGSGGGGAQTGAGGSGTTGQGNAGGTTPAVKKPSGGGGAGEPGGVASNSDSGAGGAGLPSDITGEEIYYAGGGGGGGYGSTPGTGGIGGGGNGARNIAVATRQATTLPDGRNEYDAECGVDGLGGGGGGGNNINTDYSGRPGGRGTVIIREFFNRFAVALDASEVVYDPVSQALPTVTVKDALDGTLLVQGTDYDVAFSNTTAVGTATVYITGRGAYSDYSAQTRFAIYPVIHVTAYSLAEEGDGLSWSSPMSLTNAIATASADDIIFLKAGTYTPTANIAISKPLVILGGFAGTDNTTLDPDSPMSVFDANMNTAVTAIFNVTTATGVDTVNVFERIEVKNGYERGFLKSGNASLVFRNCAFTACGTTRAANYNGRGGSFTGTAQSTLTFENCTFARNAFAASAYMLNLGSGFGAYIATWKNVYIDDTLFVSNGLSSAMVNGGYNGSGRDGNAGAAFAANAAPLTVRNTAFRANLAGTTSGNGRGTVVYVTGSCNGSQFQNCIFAGNACEQCHNNGFQDTAQTGVLVLAADSVSRTLTVDGCTFAYNVFDGTFGAAGICAVKGALTVRNSIFFGAKGGARRRCGKDLHVYDTATANVDYCLFEEDSDDCFTTALPNILVMGEHNAFGDPLFATPLSAITPYYITYTSGANTYTGYNLAAFDAVLATIDVHVSNTAAAFSRAIDTGDPSSPYANEPAPNGGVVNLGAYGNTAEAATSTFQGLPTLAAGDISISFADDTRPTVSATLGGSTPYNALFKIEISGEDLSQGGAVVESVVAGGVQTGESLTLAGLGYYTPGEPLYVRITVTAPGQSAIVVNTSATVTGTLPPYVGHGGGASVIHVREGADGLQDGSDWANAFASFTEAQRALAGNAAKTEMWVAGTIVETVAPASVTIAAPLTIRGGFTGLEDSADERVAGAVSTLDGNDACNLLCLNNAAANPIKVERLIFARAYKRALENTGVGALAVTDCQFVNSRAVGPSGTNDDYGRGAYLNGKFVAAFTNCVFRGNVKVNLGSSHAQGSAIYAEGLTRVFVDNCLFMTNGVIPTSALGESTSGRDQADGDCIYMYNSPITATRCHFRGNRGAIRYNGGRTSGGVILLRGTCGGSAFTNCTFTGNWGGWATHKSSMSTTYVAGGTVDIRLNSATDKVDFENCTIAYNLGDTLCIPGGLHVEAGDVNMHNCIIFGNRHGRMTLDGIGHDIYVRGTSKLNLSHCLLAAADAETPGKPDTNYVSAASTATLTYDNLTFGDPLFLTPLADFESAIKVETEGSYVDFSSLDPTKGIANFDVHLRSKYGMYNNAGEFVKASGYLSDAIDAGDRNSPYQNEPQPNGRRVNLGAYGNTPWASMSMSYGSVYYLR